VFHRLHQFITDLFDITPHRTAVECVRNKKQFFKSLISFN